MADLTPANDMTLPLGLPVSRRQKIRKILLKLSLVLTVLGPLLFIIAALGAKLGLWGWQFGLGVLSIKVGPPLLMLGAIIGLVALVAAILIKPKKGIIIAVIGIAIPGFALGRLGAMKATVAELPFIHDVTTDTQNPPAFGTAVMTERAKVEDVNTADYIGKKAPAKTADGKPTQKLVSVLQTKAYPEIRPLVLSETKDVVFGEALATAKSMGWAIKEEDLAAGRIDATDTTFWYGFEDDITIRLRESEGGGTIIDVRSLSRVGGSDLGKNADRVGEFLERLAQ